jgi:hypothetical protein
MSTPPQWGMPYWLAILAAVLGFVVARQRVEYRPVAWFLGGMTAIDVGRFVLARVVDFEGAPRPHVGMVRLAFHADELGFLAWPAGLAALALVVFAARRSWPVLAVYLATWAALVALYPSAWVRGDGLRRVYLAAFLVGLLTYVASLAKWGAKRVKPEAEHAVLLVLGATEVARILSFSAPIVARWGAWMPPGNGVLYAVIAAMEGVFLWTQR